MYEGDEMTDQETVGGSNDLKSFEASSYSS